MFFGVHKFGNTSSMMVIFLWKCSEFNQDFKIVQKNAKNAFFFWDNCIWVDLNMEKILWLRFQQCLIQLNILVVEGSSETGVFRHLFNHVFRARSSRETSAMRAMVFWKCSNLIYILKLQKKDDKTIFVSETIASELASLDFLYKVDNTCDRHSIS